jgi:hypothetical protein
LILISIFVLLLVDDLRALRREVGKQQNPHSQHRNGLAPKSVARTINEKRPGGNTYRIAEEGHIGYPKIRKRRKYETEQTLRRQPRDVLN